MSRRLAIPSAGNAAGAMAAYAAAAGIEAHIFMPRDVPQANYIECKASGAKVTLVDGLINDCGRIVAERAKQEGWFEVSTLKEPYRIEGKKTMGYEVAEHLSGRCPTRFFIQPVAESDSLACGRRLRRWKHWAGSTPSVQR